MHDVSEGELGTIVRPEVLFYHTNELEIPELANAKTDLPENHQDNGATPLVDTQPFLLYSPPQDTLVASAEPPPHPRIKARDAAIQL